MYSMKIEHEEVLPMWYLSNKMIIPAVIMCLISLLFCLPVYGEPTYDGHGDLIAHGAFEYSGVINQLPVQRSGGGGEIIIDDRVYQLSSDCILRNQAGRLVGISSFADGMSVNFFVLDEIQITKMWQVAEENDAEDSDENREIGGGTVPESDIRLENGVWTN